MDTDSLANSPGRAPRRQPAGIPVVLQQHAEDAAAFYATRALLVGAPHVKLHHLRRLDDRLAAHLDGLAVAGEDAWPFCEAALESPSSGAVFTAAVRAISDKRNDRLDRLFALVAAQPEIRNGLVSAFGWTERQELRGLVAELLGSRDPLRRYVGIATCALHRVDPGLIPARRCEDPDPTVRARAWRTVGELGTRELVNAAGAASVADTPACRFWAAWSAVLLGDRHTALETLATMVATPGPFRSQALRLAIQSMGVTAGRDLLKLTGADPAGVRNRILGTGLLGDPVSIPWLIDFMADEPLARLAGEAFTTLTGVDLAALELERKPPESFESGPNDAPDDPNVEMEEDDGLPWPDQMRVQTWWRANGQRFPAGTRYFMGEPLERHVCLRVLQGGYQRQRRAASLYLSLLNPGTPLFEWRAPAWRQKLPVEPVAAEATLTLY
jgi:uncharacterized protein (TIGR02270 family)